MEPLCAHRSFHRDGTRIRCDECNRLYDVSAVDE